MAHRDPRVLKVLQDLTDQWDHWVLRALEE